MINTASIKTIIVDLDRTLLHTDKTLSTYTVNVLNECKKCGIKIMVATARPFRTTKQYCDFAYWEFDETSVDSDSCDVYAKFTLNSRYKYSQVLGASMSPALNLGDYIIIVTEATEFQVNDIIAYQCTGSSPYIVHRIIEINDNEYKVKGDANLFADLGTISIEQIVGLVCENIGQTLPNDVISK